MSEKHIHYRELSRDKKLEVLESLSCMAISLVTRIPDILDKALLEYMQIKHEYGYVAFLGLHHAIRKGDIITRDDGYNLFLNLRQEG